MSTPKFTMDAIGPELRKVMRDRTIALEKLTVQEAYFLMQACQLTARHPLLGPEMEDRFTAIGRRLQELVRPHVSTFFAEFMESGWYRESDV